MSKKTSAKDFIIDAIDRGLTFAQENTEDCDDTFMDFDVILDKDFKLTDVEALNFDALYKELEQRFKDHLRAVIEATRVAVEGQ
jgi:predicted kinase